MSKADYVRAAEPGNDDPQHHCHWPGCKAHVNPRFYACRRHWYTWPEAIRNAIWAAYRPGQEIHKNPSSAYLDAARAADAWAREYERTKRTPNPGQGSLL